MANPAEPLWLAGFFVARRSWEGGLNGEAVPRPPVAVSREVPIEAGGSPTTMLPPTTDDGSSQDTAAASVHPAARRNSLAVSARTHLADIQSRERRIYLMDSQKFDTLVKTLASGTSRRRVLKGLAATAFGGVVVATGASGVDARRCSSASECPSCPGCQVETCEATTGNARKCGCAQPPPCRNASQSRCPESNCKCTGSCGN
jgi:hypothetical protein